MATWLTDEHGNRCSVKYFGSEEQAKKALNSLEHCRDCTNCSDCSRPILRHERRCSLRHAAARRGSGRMIAEALRAIRDLTPRDAVAAAVMAVFLWSLSILLDHPAVVAILSGSAR